MTETIGILETVSSYPCATPAKTAYEKFAYHLFLIFFESLRCKLALLLVKCDHAQRFFPSFMYDDMR